MTDSQSRVRVEGLWWESSKGTPGEIAGRVSYRRRSSGRPLIEGGETMFPQNILHYIGTLTNRVVEMVEENRFSFSV